MQTYPRKEVGANIWLGTFGNPADPLVVVGSYGVKESAVSHPAAGIVDVDIVQGLGTKEEVWEATVAGTAAAGIVVVNSTDADTKRFLVFDKDGVALDAVYIKILGIRIGPLV